VTGHHVKKLVPVEKFVAAGMNQSAAFFGNEKRENIFFGWLLFLLMHNNSPEKSTNC
jgi:hypothetical protein